MQQQLIEMEKKPNVLAFKGALAYAVYFLALIYIFKMIGIDTNNTNLPLGEKILSSALSYIPFILAIVYVQTNHKKELGGYITFGRAFSAGFKVAAYSGLFLAVLLMLYYKVLDRSAFDNLIDKAKEAAGDDENKIKGVEMMRPYMIYFIGFGAAITYTFFGLIVSLIGAAIVKKEKPLYEEAEEIKSL
ncbi:MULTISPECIES: DUF4199 domain-containing protein [unclassified Pedobacter]|jgi:hypothetical protein|uniref:DUF4199 domain-containing protein n=1 Tax=unclassified Pedobacter TaxID=2628915 RepID=UPI000D37863B|nr:MULTISPECIES: DUF4199 domain-containing protein [unclassified Pedobacter]PTT00407.1 hypothetical protein DBR11_10085 [Pedobacter sp. HMWF019]HWW40973.1 DUF4199 domain-containing protein [Pedobacter sp.]